MDKHFNGLTPAKAERLAILMEECGEVIQVCGKILRHGYESTNPVKDDGITSRLLLEKELGDLQAAVLMMTENRDVYSRIISEHADKKIEAIKPYLHHQTHG